MARAAGRASWISALEAIQTPIVDEQSWLREISKKIAASDGLPSDVFGNVRLTHSPSFEDVKVESALGPDPRFLVAAGEVTGRLEAAQLRALYYPAKMVTTLGAIFEEMARTAVGEMRAYMKPYGMSDALGITMHPEPGCAVVLFSATSSPVAVNAERKSVLTRVGLHLETALRLHRRPESVRAVITPDGRIEQLAPGLAPSTLVEHVKNVERARTRRERHRVEAVDLWPALVAGEASIVEREDGGRRYYFALANPHGAQPIRALSKGELDVLSLATRGMSSKESGYALGISASVVSRRLSNAASKIGVATPLELVRIAAMFARDPRARFEETALTVAERDVLELVEQGLSNARIAALRHRSVRTIANQVASLLRKTGTSSRRELVAAAP